MAASTRDFALVGLSHKTAPVEVREKLAVGGDLPALLAQMRALPGAEEALLVSTCNRVEAYVFGLPSAGDALKDLLAARGGDGAREALYTLRGAEALVHLFRVASSLDSMILGEPQILGQVKDAYGAAQQAGTLGGPLAQAGQAAFVAAKRVRTETAIGSAAVSMASAAVELAKKIFGSLDGRTVLLVGAGKMSELTARHLSGCNSRILVTNRTFERGQELARKVGGAAHPFDRLQALLAEADIVVSSTAAPRPVLTVPLVQQVIKARHYRPLFLVDLAVPRDVEPGVGDLENVYAYDVDDLEHVVDQGRAAREVEARKAEQIVRDEVEKFLKARRLRDALPVIAQLRSQAEEIARAEAERTIAQFGEELAPRQRKSIEAMGRAIVNKLLHAPTARLRDAGKASPEEAAALAELVAELFDLGRAQEAPAARGNGAEHGAVQVPAAKGNGAEHPANGTRNGVALDAGAAAPGEESLNPARASAAGKAVESA